MPRRAATIEDASGVRRIRTATCAGGIIREVTFGEGLECVPCGGCPYYYLATMCNESCAPTGRHAYICATPNCPPGSPHKGPLVNGQVIRLGPKCYTVDTRTRYCPPGVSTQPVSGWPGDPVEKCQPMPVRAPIIDKWHCEPDCGLPHCRPIRGYYKARPCSNTPAFGTERYICCELYEIGLEQYACPVFGNCGGGVCWYVPPGTQPVEEPPPGALVWCGTGPSGQFGISGTCCQCCQVTEPGCCSCDGRQVIVRPDNQCGVIRTEGFLPCRTWNPSGAGLVGGGYTLVQGLNFGNLCPISLSCYTVSQNTITVRIYSFTSDCQPGPSVQCNSGVCGLSLPYRLQDGPGNPSVFQVQIDPCEPLSGIMCGQQHPFLTCAGEGGFNGCCPSGTRYGDCHEYSSSFQLDLTPCGGGQKTTECHDFRRVTTPGTCGDDNCGQAGRPSLWLPPKELVGVDGMRMDRIVLAGGWSPPGGCVGCGSEGAASRF